MIQNTEMIWIKAGLTKTGKKIHLTSSYSNNQPDCARSGMNTNVKVVYKLALMQTAQSDEWDARLQLTEKLVADGHTSNYCEGCFKWVVA
jgi:hypothetical protein